MSTAEECPDDLVVAIAHALKIHGWYKNLAKEEVPPRYIWPFDELLVEWFQRVAENREARRNGEAPADSEGEGSKWEQNEFARGLRD